jgi:hypothetical protein
MKQYLILHSLDEYKDFHDTIWFKKFFTLIDGTFLNDIGDHFGGNLYGATRAFVLPWILIDSIYNNNSRAINRKYIWEQFKRINAFNAALGKTSENCYVAIYCAYEDYILQSIKVVLSEDKIRVTDRDFNRKLTSVIEERVASKCWNNNKFDLAKEIRHCLVHNGGRPTESLLKKQNLPEIVENNILITPIEVRELYSIIKECVYIFTSNLIEKNANV